MKLPIPIYTQRISGDSVIITQADLKEMSTAGIADTKKLIKKGQVNQAIHNWISEGIASFISADGEIITEKAEIRKISYDMPIRTAEMLAAYICIELGIEDAIEGYYECPRCHKPIISELSNDDDTRDHIGDLKHIFMEVFTDRVTLKLSSKVQLKGKSTVTKQESVYDVEEVTILHPTLKHSISASGKYGVDNDDDIRRQCAIYTEALIQINGEDISAADKVLSGMKIFTSLNKTDMRRLGIEVSKYGLGNTISKTCTKCHKTWECSIDTSNFFASAVEE